MNEPGKKAVPGGRPPGSLAGEGLQGLFIALEMSWLGAIVLFMEDLVPGPGRASLGLVCWLYPAAYLLARKGLARGWSWKRELGWGSALGLLALAAGLSLLFPVRSFFTGPGFGPGISLLELKRSVIVVVGGAFVWLRGWYLARKRVDRAGMAAGFQTGLVVLFVVLFLTGMKGEPWPGLMGVVAVFLSSGLGGLWLARFRETAGRAGPRPGPSWFILAAGSVGLVLILGAVFMVLVDRSLLELLLKPLSWLWDQLVRLLTYLMSLLPKPKPLPLPEMNLPLMPPRAPAPSKLLIDLSWVRPVAEVIFMGSSLTILAMSLFRVLQDLVSRLSRLTGTPGARFEASGIGFWDDLRNLWAGLRRLAGWLWDRLLLRGRRPEGRGQTNREGATVRGVYRHFIRWGAARGRPMAPAQTPYEYRADLAPLIPGCGRELDLLTETYVLVRYGRMEPEPDLVDQVRRAWRRIKSAGAGTRKGEEET